MGPHVYMLSIYLQFDTLPYPTRSPTSFRGTLNDRSGVEYTGLYGSSFRASRLLKICGCNVFTCEQAAGRDAGMVLELKPHSQRYWRLHFCKQDLA